MLASSILVTTSLRSGHLKPASGSIVPTNTSLPVLFTWQSSIPAWAPSGRSCSSSTTSIFLWPPITVLLGQLLDGAEDALVYHLDLARLSRLGITNPSATFHGRDIFAPVAAEIASGHIAPMHVGKLTSTWTPGWIDEPDVTDKSVTGTIVTVDSFGNLISNIDEKLICGFKNPVAHIGGHDISMLQTYGRAQPGDYLALVNSFGRCRNCKGRGQRCRKHGARTRRAADHPEPARQLAVTRRSGDCNACFSSFAQESRSVTMRLNTRASFASSSGSGQK